MLYVTVLLAEDNDICCWLLVASEMLGLCLWQGINSREAMIALWFLPHSLEIIWLPEQITPHLWLLPIALVLAWCCSLSRQAVMLRCHRLNWDYCETYDNVKPLFLPQLFLGYYKAETQEWPGPGLYIFSVWNGSHGLAPFKALTCTYAEWGLIFCASLE